MLTLDTLKATLATYQETRVHHEAQMRALDQQQQEIIRQQNALLQLMLQQKGAIDVLEALLQDAQEPIPVQANHVAVPIPAGA